MSKSWRRRAATARGRSSPSKTSAGISTPFASTPGNGSAPPGAQSRTRRFRQRPSWVSGYLTWVDNREQREQEETMSTLENRPNTALLVIDVQNGVVGGAHERDAVVGNVGSLVEKARRERVPVVWVQHSDEQLARGSDEWRIVPELSPGDAEPLIEKNHGDSFEATPLETVL